LQQERLKGSLYLEGTECPRSCCNLAMCICEVHAEQFCPSPGKKKLDAAFCLSLIRGMCVSAHDTSRFLINPRLTKLVHAMTKILHVVPIVLKFVSELTFFLPTSLQACDRGKDCVCSGAGDPRDPSSCQG